MLCYLDTYIRKIFLKDRRVDKGEAWTITSPFASEFLYIRSREIFNKSPSLFSKLKEKKKREEV